jgi:hypothetical protein
VRAGLRGRFQYCAEGVEVLLSANAGICEDLEHGHRVAVLVEHGIPLVVQDGDIGKYEAARGSRDGTVSGCRQQLPASTNDSVAPPALRVPRMRIVKSSRTRSPFRSVQIRVLV